MKFILVSIALLVLGLAMGARQESAGPEWHTDLNAAFELAQESSKPLLLVFR